MDREIKKAAPALGRPVGFYTGATPKPEIFHEFPWITLKKGDRLPKPSAASRAISNAKRGYTEFVETGSDLWANASDLEIFEQTRVGANGHAVTLLWAKLPDHNIDEGGLQELGLPQFR